MKALAVLAAIPSFGGLQSSLPCQAQSSQKAPSPFKATAQLGVPITVGLQEYVIGTKEKVDTGNLRVLTISAARVAAVYPNAAEIVSAGPGEKLLVLRGSLMNPCTMELPFTTSSFLGIRFRDGKGKGPFKYAGLFDPNSHEWVQSNLRKGQSAAFECVIRIPADFDSYRVGFYYRSPAKVAWYDFKPRLGRMNSTFSPDGYTLANRATGVKNQSFDIDVYRMKVLGISEPAEVGGVAKGSQPVCVVSVAVANTMLLPVRWGWQYVTPELVMNDGSTVTADRDLIDKGTNKTWSGDLAPGATMTAQFVFRPAGGQIPVAFRLKVSPSERTIEVPL